MTQEQELHGKARHSQEGLKRYLMSDLPGEPSETIVRNLYGSVRSGVDPFHIKIAYGAGLAVGKSLSEKPAPSE